LLVGTKNNKNPYFLISINIPFVPFNKVDVCSVCVYVNRDINLLFPYDNF